MRSHVAPVRDTSDGVPKTPSCDDTLDKQSASNQCAHMSLLYATPAMAFQRRLPVTTRMFEVLTEISAKGELIHMSFLYERHQRWRSIDALQETRTLAL
jgi:hypothetical protein